MEDKTKDTSLDICMNTLNNFLEENRVYFWTEFLKNLTNKKKHIFEVNNEKRRLY